MGKCRECGKRESVVFGLRVVLNDLCFWEGFGKYKGEEWEGVGLGKRRGGR